MTTLECFENISDFSVFTSFYSYLGGKKKAIKKKRRRFTTRSGKASPPIFAWN